MLLEVAAPVALFVTFAAAAERQYVGENFRSPAIARAGHALHRARDAFRAPHPGFVRCDEMAAFRTAFV
jgi:hypothetical protein